jgi:hypothetical protein
MRACHFIHIRYSISLKCHSVHDPFSRTLRSYTHIQATQIRATLVCFYMLRNMTLSAATPANRRSDQARRSSRSWRQRRPERTKRAEGPLSPTLLIYGSAIKTSANSPAFNNIQFSNRRQTGGLTIASNFPGKIRSGGPLPAHHSSSITRRCSHLAFRAPGATLFPPNRTCQSSPPNGRERPSETCENRIT